jgi:UDPglucose 6-dehydrogenase
MFKKVGIVGNGFVGNALYENFKNFVEVEVHDLVTEKSTVSLQELVDFADVIFVCVPTPSNTDGSCNTIYVENVVKHIYSLDKYANVVIKSTVPPGTTSALAAKFPEMSLAFNPEFLTEANSHNDFRDQKLIVIGSEVEQFRNQLREFYVQFVLKCSKENDAKVVCVEPSEAEMFKYLANCFLATKLTFANEMYQLCLSSGIDYSRLSQIAELDERLGKTHWKVPGSDGKLGWGGSCFPKDTNALVSFARTNDSPLVLLEQAIDLNNKHRS